MFSKEQSVFVLVDVQGKLAHMVHESDQLINNLERLINGLRILKIPIIWLAQYVTEINKLINNLDRLINGLRIIKIPIIWLEQYPQGLGPTTEKVAQHLSGLDPISKITFDACKNDPFMQAIQATERKQMIVAGIETHICVYQTATGLKLRGY